MNNMMLLAINPDYINYAVVVGFLVLVSVVGVAFARKEKNTTDYLLGGRQMPWLAVMFSMIMALFSAISFVAVPGEAYANGLRMWIQGIITSAFIPLGMWMFVRFYYKLGSFTPYEYLERRFSPSIRLLASSLFLITRGFYLAVVLYASAKAFEGAFGWKSWVTICLLGVIGTVYTTLGGSKAVIWTDVIQFFVLVGGVIITAIALTLKVDGGVAGIFKYAFENDRGFNFSDSFFSTDPYQRVTFWWMLLSGIAATLGYYATDQITIQKLLSTRNYKQAQRAAYTKIPVSIAMISIFWFIGIALFTYYHQADPVHAAQLTGDKAFTFFITDQLPAPVPGLIMAGLLAATMTTLNSGMNSLSAVGMKDIYGRFINTHLSDKKELAITRLFSVLVAAFTVASALYITWLSNKAGSSVLEAVGIWQSLGGIVLAIFILGVTTRKVNTAIITVSTVIGSVCLIAAVAVLYYMAPVDHRISFILVGNTGLLVTLACGYIAGLFVKTEDGNKTEGLTLFTINDG